jgi:hypothetical protein
MSALGEADLMNAPASLLRGFGTAVFLLLAGSRSALAADAMPAPHFEVTRLLGADDCPDAQELASTIALGLGSAPAGTASARGTPAHFQVMFSRGTDYVAIVRNDAIGAERTIVSPGATCAALAQAVAVSVAVLLDVADAAKTDAPPTSPPKPATPRPSPAPAEAPPSPPADLAGAPDDDGPLDRPARNVVFFEFLGSGISDSINYERFFANDIMSIRFGLGYGRAQAPNLHGEQLTVPVLLQLESSSSGSHNFHLGTGVTLVYRNGAIEDEWFNPSNTGFREGFDGQALAALVNIALGYRYLPRKPGLTFGLVAMGLFNANWGTLWMGGNVGATF